MMKRYALFALLVFAIPASATQGRSGDQATQTISPAPSFTPVTNERLLNSDAEPENWLHYSGNYFSQRYSGLDQINSTNAGDLEMQWAFQLRALDRAETTPLVVDGVMYVTEAPSNVIALDARTGSQYWRYNHDLPDDLNYCCGRNNRGVAVLGDRLYMGTLDAHLVSLDAKTGELLWKGGRYGYGQLLFSNGHLVVLTERGDVVLVRATPEGHDEVARFPALAGKTWNVPTIADGTLFVRNATEMAAFDIRP